MRARLLDDAGGWTSSSWFTISDAAHTLEVDWKAATAAGANNGYLTFWIDGTQQANLTGVDNDTRRIESVRLGLVNGVPSGLNATFYFDGFESRRSTYIGSAGSNLLGAEPNFLQKVVAFIRGLFGLDGQTQVADEPALPGSRNPLFAPLPNRSDAPLQQGGTVTYIYNGDGQRVKSSDGVTTVVYIGDYFEWRGDTATMTRYYYAGGQRVAMRTGARERDERAGLAAERPPRLDDGDGGWGDGGED